MDAGAEAKVGMRRHAAEEVWLVGLTAHVHFHSSTHKKRDWKRTTRADLIQAAPEVLFTAPEALYY